MNRSTEIEIMRLLQDELPEDRARELRARIERDPALREASLRLQRTWEGLSLPPPSPVPPGFAQRVMAHARADRPNQAPGWVRAAAALALVAGAALGFGVGGTLPPPESPPAADTVSESGAEESLETTDGSLAESYWLAVEDPDDGGEPSGEVQP